MSTSHINVHIQTPVPVIMNNNYNSDTRIITTVRQGLPVTQTNDHHRIRLPAQLLAAGPKYMQIGGFTLKIERIADGIVQIPSPHIIPEATAPA